MGFGKFLKKLGSAAVKGVSLAAKAGLGGPVTSILSSKLQSAGANRAKMIAAEKANLKDDVRVNAGFDRSLLAKAGLVNSGKKLSDVGSSAKVTPAQKLKLNDATLGKLGILQNEMKARAGRSLEQKTAKWKKSDWTALAKQYEAEGKPGDWEDYVRSHA